MEKNGLKSKLKIFKFIRNWCAYLLLQYELITCTCMFEPWEKYFINALVLTIFSLVIFCLWIFLPLCLTPIFSYFGQITIAIASKQIEL